VFTLGALIWFPFLQPICHELLARAGDAHHVSRALPLLLVEIFNMNNLLDVLGFFFIYYTLIWLFLRWHTQRRIDRSLWPSSPPADAQADLSLPAQVADWLSVLMAPIRVARQRLESLVRRVDALRSPP